MALIPDRLTKFNIVIERAEFEAKRSLDYYNLIYICGAYKIIFPRVFESKWNKKMKKPISQFSVGDIEVMKDKKRFRFYELIDTSTQKKVWYSRRFGIKFEQVVGSDLIVVSKMSNLFDNFTCHSTQLQYIRTNVMTEAQFDELKGICLPKGGKDFLINETSLNMAT